MMNPPSLYNGPIVDAHCHFASTRFIPRAFVEGVARNMAVKLAATGVKRDVVTLTESVILQHQDHNADGMVAAMDAAGIERAVVLLPDFTRTLVCDLTIEEMIDAHIGLSQRHPGRFYLMVGIDPGWGRDGIELFKRAVDSGHVHGLKLYPPCGYSPSDSRLYPFFEICRERGLCVLTHIGPTSPVLSFAHASPWLIDQAALDFPEVNFILAHASLHFTEDCLHLAEYRPNVYLDISAFASTSPPNAWKASLASMFAHGLNHKILFGTDWPVFGSGSQPRLIQSFVAPDGPLAQVSGVQRKWLMHDNLMRLLPAM